jgi:hypothetical protein
MKSSSCWAPAGWELGKTSTSARQEGAIFTADTISPSDVAAIARVREEWLRAVNSDDVEGLFAPMVEDYIALPPHEPPQGKEAQQGWHRNRIDRFIRG